ncbi:hypothetical protein EBT16_05100 [bacterium]|nr:hypothetical protein [bacterium]
MKSIREWMKEKGMVSEDINKLAFSNFMREPGDTGSTVELNSDLKLKLNRVVDQIAKMDEFKEEDPETLLRQIIAVVAARLAGMSGSTLSTSRAVDKMNRLGHNDEPIAQEVK